MLYFVKLQFQYLPREQPKFLGSLPGSGGSAFLGGALGHALPFAAGEFGEPAFPHLHRVLLRLGHMFPEAGHHCMYIYMSHKYFTEVRKYDKMVRNLKPKNIKLKIVIVIVDVRKNSLIDLAVSID